MYSDEIESFLRERNYEITPEECNVLMDVDKNPQICHMQFYAGINECQIDTDDDYHLRFRIKGF